MDKILIILLIISCYWFGIFVGRGTEGPSYTNSQAEGIYQLIQEKSYWELKSLRLNRELNQCEGKTSYISHAHPYRM